MRRVLTAIAAMLLLCKAAQCAALTVIGSMLAIESADQVIKHGFKIAVYAQGSDRLQVLVCHARALKRGEHASFSIDVASSAKSLFTTTTPSGMPSDGGFQRYVFTLRRELFAFSTLTLFYEPADSRPASWSLVHEEGTSSREYDAYQLALGFIPDAYESAPEFVSLRACGEV